MELAFILVGIVVGFVIAYLVLQGQKKTVQTALLLANKQADMEAETIKGLQAKIDISNDELQNLRQQLTDAKVSLGAVQAQLTAERQQNAEKEQRKQEQDQKLEVQRQQQFAAQLETVRAQFENLAVKLLDQSDDKLKSKNTETMSALTAPLKENIDKLHEAIYNTNQETAKSAASLSQQLREMAERTQKIDNTATRLANVMRGGNKIQGNWGELILTDILEQNGFKQGVNYDVQQVIMDHKGNAVLNAESGKCMVPDVILHYPKNEDVIIDSKMSIEAYELYVNTDNDDLKRKYANDLVRSVRTQFTSLAKKDYSSYIRAPRHAIDFVIMFVPNEGALQLAMATDKRLWNDAFAKHVFITSQQNLMAILKMIEIAWRQYAQTENQIKIYGIAEELLKRVGEFVKRFDKMKKDIDTLAKDYDDAYNKVYTGRQSVVRKANEMKQLGVKEAANYPIPSSENELGDL